MAAGRSTLIAAPTGSGKTLAGFLMCINDLYLDHAAGRATAGAQVVYVSPLKALAVDIAENLERPLAEIAAEAAAMGLGAPSLDVGVRTGDTTSSQRAAMVRRPPTFVVTTPESLYLMVTAARSRATLASVGTVIVDEIHALARDKRGAHLTLTLERLEHVCGRPPVRVGLSATQKPIDTVARLLVGTRTDQHGHPDAVIVDGGHQRDLDLALELPAGELEAVISGAQMDGVLDRIAELVEGRRTTLVFVNTRKLAERLAHQLGRAARRRRGGRPPRQPQQGAPAAGRVPPPGRATCGRWWPRPRWSWASTSGRSSWCARSARPVPSPPSSSGWGDPTTRGWAPRPAGCSP